jgi:uncharacterized repeat protein (TIGR03803 family)
VNCNKSCVLVRLTLFLTTLCSTLAFASERIIFAFPTNGSGGSVPAGGLISDAAGNLYGVTAAGGAYKWGGIFRLALENGAWTEALLYSFKGGAADGSQPESALLLDTSGNLYGTTSGGGPSNDGTVFKLAPDGQGGWTETVLHAFSGKDGRWPITAPLVADAKGNLYGVTEGACYYGCVNGTLFELSPQQNGSWSFRVLHRFVQSAIPLSGVILDKAGNLYGTTQYDGAINCIAGSGCGTVYKLARVGTSWKFSSIHVFHYGDGAYPEANLVMDSAGNLYGTTNGELPLSSPQPRQAGPRLCCTSLVLRAMALTLHRSYSTPMGTFLARFHRAPMRTTSFRTATCLGCLASQAATGARASYTPFRTQMRLRFRTQI